MAVYKRLGDILLSEGIITEKQLKEAVSAQLERGGKLGEVLLDLAYVTEEQIVIALSKQLAIPHVSLASGKLRVASDQNLEEIIPYEFAVKNLVLPISRNLNSLTVVMWDPLDLMLLDNVKKLTAGEVNPVVATRTDIMKAIDMYYGKDRLFKEAMEMAGEDKDTGIEKISTEGTDLSLDKLIAQAEEAPVIKLVDLIIRQGIEENASDIHLEPARDRLILRYRIDGALYEMPSPATSFYLPIISRIKILSKMDIAEKRLPQDGGFTVKLGKKFIDLRTSSLPTIYGEKVVVRILDKSRVPLELSKLGFMPQELELIRKGLKVSYGLVLLTGPTGSGKSTTLYAFLNELIASTKNILTVEDPVEYRLEGINQVQVKPGIGLSFANTLRCFLRQDPDIILVGEIRDLETSEICIRAALTGHLVLSTLHTNDAASTITRLIDIGIPHYLVVASLRLIISQRLIRKLCPHCKEPQEVEKQALPEGIDLSSPIIYKAKGCSKCNFIGYRGRTVITEVILVDKEIRELIHGDVDPNKIMEMAKKRGTLSLLESGLKKVEEGITSLEEVLALATSY